MTVRCLTESSGFCALAPNGGIFQNASGLGRRCISVFVTGATTVRSNTGALAHPIEPGKTDCSGHLDDRLHCETRNPSLFRCREKRGPEEPLDHALGRSRGGLTTKIHMVCDANGVPLRFVLSSGQASDVTHAQPLLDQVRIPGKPVRPRKRSRWLLADKGYDAEHLRRYCDRYRMQPVIRCGLCRASLGQACLDSWIVRSIGSGTSLSGCLAG